MTATSYLSPTLKPAMVALARQVNPALAEQLARAESAHPVPGYWSLPLGTHLKVTELLGGLSTPACYAALRAEGVREDLLPWTLIHLGLRPTETPDADAPGAPGGYTAYAHYSATGEGAHLWYLYAPDAQSPEAARAQWMSRFFPMPGEPQLSRWSQGRSPEAQQSARDFFAQGLQVLRGHLPLPLPESAEAPRDPHAFECHVGD